MTDREVADLLARMAALWPMRLPEDDHRLDAWIDEWQHMLADCTPAEAIAAIRLLARDEQYRQWPPPLVAIRARIDQTREPQAHLSAEEAWHVVITTIRSTHAGHEPKLPPRITTAVKAAGGFSALRNSTLDNARRAFVAAYRNLNHPSSLEAS